MVTLYRDFLGLGRRRSRSRPFQKGQSSKSDLNNRTAFLELNAYIHLGVLRRRSATEVVISLFFHNNNFTFQTCVGAAYYFNLSTSLHFLFNDEFFVNSFDVFANGGMVVVLRDCCLPALCMVNRFGPQAQSKLSRDVLNRSSRLRLVSPNSKTFFPAQAHQYF